jgi:YfiH family protein
MKAIDTVDMGLGVIAGVTRVDTSVLPWPGASFGITPSADAGHVERSYEMLAETLGVQRNSIVTAQQVHGKTIVDVTARGSFAADALVTATPGLVVGVKLADCCGVLLYDSTHRVVAAVHSGWRGTAQNIVAATIEHMQGAYGTNPHDLRAHMSACASGSVYEVGQDVYDVLAAYCKPLAGGKWTFDNHMAIEHQLLDAGLQEEKISVDTGCTMSDESYHSFRRDKERSGRMLAFIGFQ